VKGNAVLPIHDRWASRHHCQLFEHAGELHVRDLGSKHGTIVNLAPVDECRLGEGDRLMVGLTALVIQQIDACSQKAQSQDADVLVDRGSGVGA
jgi:pSer/pThr/pTyr-binding forkhead associated (FHA) protein